MNRKQQSLADIAALVATMPQPGPTDHLPYVTNDHEMLLAQRRGGSFVIGPEYGMSPRARKSLADIAELEG